MPGTAPELKFQIVRAGAGAGKTRGLVEKVVEIFRLYQREGLTPRLVVTTFTRKATQELKERLILKACEERDAALLQFASDPTKLHISTIHGLLNIFLRQYGHLAGLDAGFQLVSAGEANKMARLALRETVLERPQGLVWLETYGFARTLAMCRRYEVAAREQGGLRPATLDDLEKAAAGEIANWKSELRKLAGHVIAEVDDPKWQEFASALGDFAASWTGDGAALDGLPSKPRRSKTQGHLEDWHGRAEGTLDAFKKEMKKPCWDRARWAEMAHTWSDFAALAEDFGRRIGAMKETGARFELSDLELKAIEIIRAKPFLGALFAENWDYWMIDEYQDTSPLQVACLEALIGGKPTYYVGDPQQSIYLFRGAEVRVFDQAQAAVADRNGVKVELRRNYRSKPDLLHFINDFMTSVSPDFGRMDPRDETAEAARSCVHLIKAEDDAGEMSAVVHRVHQLLGEGASLEKICVLGRTHRTLIEASRVLRAHGFPTHVHASKGFSVRREVVDAQALWKFLVNPHDNLNLMILFRSPWFYVEDARLKEWMTDRPHSLWRKVRALENPPECVGRLTAAIERLRNFGLARAFEDSLRAAAYLDLSLVNDPAGRKESNLWKLILKARDLEQEGGQSVLDFLEREAGADLLDVTEGDATSAQEPNCINLMTIHGSKGLEFDHVIVPRMGDSPRTSATPPLDSEAGVFFFPVWSEDADTPFVPSPLDFLKVRDQRERELREFDRWLYVALTRAKSTLTLTWSEIGRDSWAARSPIFLQEPGTYAKGCYTYEILKAGAPAETYAGLGDRRGEVRAPWLAHDGARQERAAVTDLIDQKPLGAGTKDNFLKRWQAQTLGTRVHRALEALRYGHPVSEELDQSVEYVLGLDDPPMPRLIQEGEAEWGFQVQTPSRVVEGQIDLWGKVDGVLYVVDYKSGSPKGQVKAFEQLGLYAWALRKFGHREPIRLAVIYPLARKVAVESFDEELFGVWETKFGRAEPRS